MSLAIAGQHENVQRGFGRPNCGEDGMPVEPRQMPVQNHGVEPAAQRQRETVIAAQGGFHLMPRPAQRPRKEQEQCVVVFDEEHGGGWSGFH